MARQNTFTIIPQGPRFDATTTPMVPMTSKQARQAYKAASKTPSMTRAERHRWEREEQERIRKEFEKDKAAAKARLARDKKKDKEARQREEKRRNGLPLVSVRPSQGTIAGFVRGNGRKKRDAEGALVMAAQQVPLEERVEADEAPKPEPDTTVLGSILEVIENGEEIDAMDVTRDELPLLNINNENPTEHNTDAEDPAIQNKTGGKQAEEAIRTLTRSCDVELSFKEPIDDNPCEHKTDADDGQMTIHDKTDDNKTEEAIGTLIQDYDVDLSFEESIDGNPCEHKTDANNAQTIQDEANDKKTEKAIGVLSQDYDVDLSFEEPIDEAAFDATLDMIPVDETEKLPDARPLDDQTKRGSKATTEDAVDFLPSQDLLDEEINTDMMEELEELMSGGKTSAKPQAVKTSPSPRQRPQHKPPTPGPCQRESPLRHRIRSLTSPERPRQPPPMGTQAILVNPADFFPSSSQQLRELDEEQEAEQEVTPTPAAHDTHHTTPNAHMPPQSATPPAGAKLALDTGDLESEFGSFPCTAHFSLLEPSAAPHPPRPTPRIRRPSASPPRPQPVSEPELTAPPPPPPPPRFFTSSGSRVQLSLAIQSSRRSAAKEQRQEMARQRQEASLVLQLQQQDEARRRRSSPVLRQGDPDASAGGGGKVAAAAQQADKENVLPEMRGSQETEYGGDWVEDEAWDLALC
ncbi:hypothetical protein A9K55_006829 [Cordyceps militaris]|uniref:Uncharacterized protein n=1 Tax=Cordyceps militaris TaxID=73501 RepID=A0A2H4SBW4_CORMI|nr:hypothetical protein A9K55_006829 [Cordyceps militaris]